MRTGRTKLALFSIFFLLALTAWVLTRGPFGYHYPTAETRSHFIAGYTPEHVQEVIKPLIAEPVDMSSGVEAGAGRSFVTNNVTIEPNFAARPEAAPLLMAALSDDITWQLIHDGGKIASKTGDYGNGLQFTYRSGQTIGAVTLSSSITNRRAPHYTTGPMVAPPAGAEYMLLSIRITEKWFPNEERATQATVGELRDPTE